MFLLRKRNPPFGTEDSPIWEYTYSEQVRVVDGRCDVKLESTRDFLLKMGYEEVNEGELAGVGIGISDHAEERSNAPRLSNPPSKYGKKKKR